MSDTKSALDWNALGQTVRALSLQAVALHFAAEADAQRRGAGQPELVATESLS